MNARYANHTFREDTKCSMRKCRLEQRSSLAFCRTFLHLILLDRVQHDFVRVSRSITWMTLWPVVRNSVRKDRPVATERWWRNRARARVECLQSCAWVFVPKVDCPVRPAGGECTMYGMEIDVIHGKHEGLVFRCWCLVTAMAFERKVTLWILLIDILDSYATLYTAHGETSAVRKTGYYACLPL